MIDMILAIVCQIGYATIDTDSLKKLIRARSCTRALAFTHLKVSYLAFTAPPETLAQSHALCSLESAGRPIPARTLACDRFQNSRLRSSMRKPIHSLVTCSNDRRCHFRLHHYRHGLPRQSLHPCFRNVWIRSYAIFRKLFLRWKGHQPVVRDAPESIRSSLGSNCEWCLPCSDSPIG